MQPSFLPARTRGITAGSNRRERGRFLASMLALALLLPRAAASDSSTIMSGSMEIKWSEGAADCAKTPQPPLEVHRYEEHTFILRENLCATFEAPFLYLLIGENRALLIDTGDVAEPEKMPLANRVFELVPGNASGRFPLLVVHTHRHLDHRAGDAQFVHLPNVEVVGFDLASVKSYYHFVDWPQGTATIDLGQRVIDVLPTPGHNETEVTFYDRNTGLVFSGDFLMPARLLIDDSKADRESAVRLAAFLRDRPVTYVLGGHIEMNAQGQMYDWETQFHPNEHVLQLTREDVLALPGHLAAFNGFYRRQGSYVMMNSIRLLELSAAGAALGLACLAIFAVRLVRRRKTRNRSAAA